MGPQNRGISLEMPPRRKLLSLGIRASGGGNCEIDRERREREGAAAVGRSNIGKCSVAAVGSTRRPTEGWMDVEEPTGEGGRRA